MQPVGTEHSKDKNKSGFSQITPLTIARVSSIILVVGISVYIYSIREQAAELAIYGYPGIFLLSFMAYATVILPAPGVALVVAMGAVFNPLGVGIAAGAGAALGEITGYLAGFSGQAVIEKTAIFDKLTGWMQQHGSLTVFLLSVVPNPFFDLAGAAAGALKMPLVRFLFWCWIGETIKMIIFAYSGSLSLGLFE